MRRPAVAVVALAFLAALGATAWLVREMKEASATSDSPGQPSAPPALAPAGAADHLPSRATATAGAPGVLEGSVANDAGTALAGVRVKLASRADGRAGLTPIEVRTGFDGRFAFDGVEPGRAVLLAAQDGVALGVSLAVLAVAERKVEVALRLSEPGVLEGTVGGARGTTEVVVVPLRPGPGPGQVARAPVAEGGAYRLAVPAGEYRAHAAPAGAARLDQRATPSFTAVAAGRTTRLELTAAPASAEAGVAVKVLEPGGEPAAGAEVAVSRPGDPKIAFAAATGDDGVLRLASEMGMAGREVRLDVTSGGRQGQFTGTLPASGEVPIRLAPGGAVAGRIAGALPADGVALTVAVEPSPGGWRTLESLRIHGDRFDLGDLPPGPVRLSARTSDGRAAEAEVRLVSGATTPVTLTLRAVAVPASR
jgi:hypothetical protein